MSRRPRRIQVKEIPDAGEGKNEGIEDILASIDSLQKKRHESNPKSYSAFPLAKIFGMIVIITVIGFAAIVLGNIPLLGPTSIDNSNLSDLDFKIQLLDESEVWLSDYEGNPIILDLFATWCTPCKTQIAELQSIKASFPSVRIISVSVDLNDNIPSLIAYKDTNGMNWVVGRDITQRGGQLFSATSIPTVAFINSDGELTQYYQGVVYYETLAQWISDG
ncbi:MAG: TlpA family protein disulfide reductase [Candidatus Heimdallarchaeota archaeon]|nr:TlpA family protein disulfide reductase [Candidatus Heimdallarchaeota archaeon]